MIKKYDKGVMIMDNIAKIMHVLEKEKTIYEELLTISREKKEVIVEGKIQELDNFLKVEGNLILEISRLEDERDIEAEALAKKLGCPREELTISYVCNSVKDERCSKLWEIANSIGEILSQLKEINDLNGKLIEQSLEYINFSMNLMADSIAGQKAIYEGKTEGSKENNIRLFDAKV